MIEAFRKIWCLFIEYNTLSLKVFFTFLLVLDKMIRDIQKLIKPTTVKPLFKFYKTLASVDCTTLSSDWKLK